MDYWLQRKTNILQHKCFPVEKETPTQVFSCGICETFKNRSGCF